MENLCFVQIEKNNEQHLQLFQGLLIPYFEEIDSHSPDKKPTPKEVIIEYSMGMMNMQGPHDRHLELCFDGDLLIGFYYAKVDHIGHKGYIKPEYGYIMEFYVCPEYRRKGYGTSMFARIEGLFQSHNVKRMYLTADPVTGMPFWESLGFKNTGEKSPENHQMIYEKCAI